MSVLSAIDLDAYCAPLMQPGARAEFAARTGLPADTARLYLDAVCNEAQIELDFACSNWRDCAQPAAFSKSAPAADYSPASCNRAASTSWPLSPRRTDSKRPRNWPH